VRDKFRVSDSIVARELEEECLRFLLTLIEFVIVELITVKVLSSSRTLLVSQSLSSEEIDSTRNYSFLEVFSDLVIEFELLVEVVVNRDVGSIVGRRRFGRGEEGEERVCRNNLLDDSSLVGVYLGTKSVSKRHDDMQERLGRTLVALLLGLNLGGEVLSFFPVDLGTLSVIVNEITLVSNLILVEVALLELGVLEELLGSLVEFENESESGFSSFWVSDSDVDQVLEGLLVAFGDEFGESEVVLEGSEPEFGDTFGSLLDFFRSRLDSLGLLLRVLILLIFIILKVRLFILFLFLSLDSLLNLV